jgi:hypothetical protein
MFIDKNLQKSGQNFSGVSTPVLVGSQRKNPAILVPATSGPSRLFSFGHLPHKLLFCFSNHGLF